MVLTLSLDYTFEEMPSDTYSTSSQLRSEKGLQVAESSLRSQCNDVILMKLNGKLEVTSNISGVSITESNMESFLRSVADVVERFGLDTFFYAISVIVLLLLVMSPNVDRCLTNLMCITTSLN